MLCGDERLYLVSGILDIAEVKSVAALPFPNKND